MVQQLGEVGLAERARIIMEKPFGTDLASAVKLNDSLHETFDESQIFRIDHFLGKEAALNILAFRFANGLFEPIWNRQHIAHVQIDVPETLSIGHRIPFYEKTGAYRDMVVNHLFQVLAFMAMEPPTALEPRSIGEEKNKVFRSLSPIEPSQVVRGQYDGYLDEPGVRAHSETETFIALRCEIDNWRWAGVPFYLRTGKRMAEGARIISIAFREPPKSMFPSGRASARTGPTTSPSTSPTRQAVALVLREAARDRGMRLDKQSLQFALHETGRTADLLEAYERLIYDAMSGDHTLFTSAEGIESLWERSKPLLENPPPVRPYPPGSWGPNAIHQLVAPGRLAAPVRRGWRRTRAGVRARQAGCTLRPEHDFSGSCAQVADVLYDPEFHTHLDLPDLSRPRVVEHRVDGTTRVLRLRYEYIGQLDPIARKIIGGRKVTWSQELRLDAATYKGTLSFEADADPRRLNGLAQVVISARGDDGHSRRRLAGDFHVRARCWRHGRAPDRARTGATTRRGGRGARGGLSGVLLGLAGSR